MSGRIRLWLLAILVCFMWACGHQHTEYRNGQRIVVDGDEMERRAQESEANVNRFIIVQGNRVFAPVSRYVLLRNQTNACAIRFTAFSRTGGWIASSQFEAVFQGDGSGNFISSTAISSAGNLRQALAGLLSPLDVDQITCGTFRIFWHYPTAVGFSATSREDEIDVGNEIAPTKWVNLADVNINDPSLMWYKRGSLKRNIRIPIE